MNSTTLTPLGIALGAVALCASAYLLYEVRSLLKLKKTFFAGGQAADLETLLHSIARHVHDLEREQLHTQTRVAELERALQFAVQKIGVVRFNPFADGGGNFSFSIALLDGQDSGLVITSMHGREQNRIYTKKIVRGGSETQLTEEEQEAVKQANKIQPINQP